MAVPQSLPQEVAALLGRMVAVEPTERPTLLEAFNALLQLHAIFTSQGHAAEHLTTAWGALMHEGLCVRQHMSTAISICNINLHCLMMRISSSCLGPHSQKSNLQLL